MKIKIMRLTFLIFTAVAMTLVFSYQSIKIVPEEEYNPSAEIWGTTGGGGGGNGGSGFDPWYPSTTYCADYLLITDWGGYTTAYDCRYNCFPTISYGQYQGCRIYSDPCIQATCETGSCGYKTIPNCPAAPAPPPTTTTTQTQTTTTTTPPTTTTTTPIPPCTSDADCSSDKVCSGGKCVLKTDKPEMSNFKFGGDVNYFNVFWNVSYPSGRQSSITIECTFNCDPRIQDCSNAQRCQPYPFTQTPGSGGCSVVSPKYTANNKVICKAYDTNNANLFNWY